MNHCVLKTVKDEAVKISNILTLFKMGLFGAAHGWG